MVLSQLAQGDPIAPYFVVGGGLLLAVFALLATRDAFRDSLEWPPALMVGAIHVDLSALNDPILNRHSVFTSSEFLGFLLALHLAALGGFAIFRNMFVSYNQIGTAGLVGLSYRNLPSFVRPLMLLLGGAFYSVLFYLV